MSSELTACQEQESETKEQYASRVFGAQTSFLKGEILTIVEAAITNEQQLKSVKDLVHSAFRSRCRYVDSICSGNAITGIGEEPCSAPQDRVPDQT